VTPDEISMRRPRFLLRRKVRLAVEARRGPSRTESTAVAERKPPSGVQVWLVGRPRPSTYEFRVRGDHGKEPLGKWTHGSEDFPGQDLHAFLRFDEDRPGNGPPELYLDASTELDVVRDLRLALRDEPRVVNVYIAPSATRQRVRAIPLPDEFSLFRHWFCDAPVERLENRIEVVCLDAGVSVYWGDFSEVRDLRATGPVSLFSSKGWHPALSVDASARVRRWEWDRTNEVWTSTHSRRS
jgi:hypothetical protein